MRRPTGIFSVENYFGLFSLPSSREIRESLLFGRGRFKCRTEEKGPVHPEDATCPAQRSFRTRSRLAASSSLSEQEKRERRASRADAAVTRFPELEDFTSSPIPEPSRSARSLSRVIGIGRFRKYDITIAVERSFPLGRHRETQSFVHVILRYSSGLPMLIVDRYRDRGSRVVLASLPTASRLGVSDFLF